MADQAPTSILAVEGATQVRTFLIADVRGYTRFTLEQGDEAAAKLASRFAEVASEVVARREGQVIELRGDEALAVFTSARQALRASVDLRDRFLSESRESSFPFNVGIGLDSGEAIPVAGGYRGAALNLAARLCALAGPGEVLASDTVANLARKIDGVEYADRGMVELKGFTDAVKVIAVNAQAIQALDEAEPEVDDVGLQFRVEQHLPIGGFLGSLPSGILIGRDEELAQVLIAVDGVADGNGRLVMLAGEPGAGKTRLAQEVTLAVRNRGFLVAAGSCFEPRQHVPHYPFLDVLATLYGAAPSALRSQVQQRWPYMARLLPEAGIPAPSLSEGEEEQDRLFRAVTGFTQTLADTIPLALFLDDIHWADEASLDLLQHLARHTRGNRVLILAGYRDVEVQRQHPLERILRDLNRAGVVDRIAVRRLGQEGTASLMASVFGEAKVSDEFASLVYRRTDGNPFFTQEVLRALVERGDIYEEDGRWERREVEEIEVPESVRSVIGERLSRLEEATQEVLHEASVLGQTFAFDSLQVMSEHDEQKVEAMLDEAMNAGIIREMGRDSYGFNHALTQQALYAELSGRRKRRLHLAAGEALEKLPESKRQGSVAELAWHFIEGDDLERGLRYSLLAGDGAETVGARAEAKRQYRTAVGLARELHDEPRLARALFELGALLIRSQEDEEALALLNEAAELFHAQDDVVMQGRSTLQIAGSYGLRGLASELNAALERAEGLIKFINEADPSRDLALFYVDLSVVYFATGRYSESLAVAERSVTVARTLQDDHLLLRAEVNTLTPLSMLGRNKAAAELAEDIIRRAEAQGDLQSLGQALAAAAETTMMAGKFEQSRVFRERELLVKEQLGDKIYIAYNLINLLELHTWSGDWLAAREYAERASAVGVPGEEFWRTAYERAHLGWLTLWEGSTEEGLRLIEEGIRLAERYNDLQATRAGHRSLAEQDILMGEPKSAIDRLQPLLDRPGLKEHGVTNLMPTLAWAYLENGDASRAEHVAAEAIERMVEQENRRDLPDAIRVKGMVLARQERWSEAELVFNEAVSVARPMPYPYAEARILYEWAKMLRNKGDGEQSRHKLEEALTIFQRLGAKKDIERTELALVSVNVSKE